MPSSLSCFGTLGRTLTADSPGEGVQQAVAGPLRARWSPLLLLLLAVLAAGCQARLALDVTVDADGAGTLAVTLAADAALAEQARALGADPLGDLAATGERLTAAGWQVADVGGDGGGRAVTLSARFAGPAEFAQVAGDLADALAAPEVVLLEDLRLAVDEDVVRLEGTAGMVPAAGIAEHGLEPAEAVDLLAAERPLVYEVTVSLAGELLASSAPGATPGDRAGTPLRWEVQPGQRVALLAVAERPRAPLGWLLLPAAGGLALLAGAVLAVRRRRRRRARLRLRSGGTERLRR